MPLNTIDDTLTARGAQYGKFEDHALVTQNIKQALQDSPNWHDLTPSQREAMEMVAHKFGAILCGQPNFHNLWHDCIGFLRLVEKQLEGDGV